MNKLFTKIATACVGLAMAVGVGVGFEVGSKKDALPVYALEQITNTIAFGGGASNGSYTGTFTETDNASVGWTIANFNNNSWKWNSSVSGADKTIKCGRKNTASVGSIYNTNSLSNVTFTKVDLYITALTSDSLNSLKVYGGASSGTSGTVLASTIGVSTSTTTPTTLTFANQSSYAYYTIAFDMASGSSNGLLSLDKVCFYQDVQTTNPSVIFSNPIDVVGAGSSVTNTAAGDNLGGASIIYSSSDTNVATVDSNTGEVTGVGFGSTTITATATVSGTDYSDSYTIYVTSSSTAYYTVAQARAAIDSGKGLTGQYVKGVVYQVDSYNSTYHSVTYWISDNGSNSAPFEVYSGLGIGGADFSSKDDVKVGDIVVVTGELKKNGSTYEFNYNNELVSQIHVASIAVKTAPSTVAYAEGEYFNPTGLVVTATYDNNHATTMDFAYADLTAAFTFNPTLNTTLTNETSVSISLFGKSTTQAITVAGRTITGITVTGTDMTNKTYVKGAAWDFTGLSLTITYNSGDPSIVLLSTLTAGTDFTLDHPTADGATSLTISGTYDGHSITSRTITGIAYVSEVTFTAGTDQGTSGGTSADSMSKYGITVSGTSMATTTSEYRIYGSSTLTISSSGENIRKIEFTDAGDSSKPASNIALKDGETGTYSDLMWLGDDDSAAFSPTAQARVSAIKVTTDSGYAEVHVDGLAVNGSAATIGQQFNLDIVKNKTYELDVAVTPANTSDSKVINYSVASGSGATVNSDGVITAGSTVGGTAVIRAESDADSTYYVLFNVTVIDCKTVYDIDFNCSASTTAFNATTWETTTSGSDAEYLTAGTISKVYPDANAIKFGSSSAAGSITLTTPDSVAIERVILHAKSYGGKDTPTIAVNNGTSQTPSDDWSYLIFDLGTASDEITIAGTTASNGRFYINDIYFVGEDNQAAVGAFGYAATFMNSLDEECSNLAVSTTTWGSLSSAWATMGTSYSGSQAYFLAKTAATRDAEGETPNGDVIEKALARYDYIVGKYLKAQGLTAYNDFMERNPSEVGSSKAILGMINGSTDGSTAAVIVIVSLVSITAIGGYFFIRKRKEQ
ncbi:MAG: Ig-like domain-containing protein [Bacilli bacterium]|nr:Ig-like domain-containing protein [Bacilli bacterium]